MTLEDNMDPQDEFLPLWAAEPEIDGWPLWSELPPPVARKPLTEEQITAAASSVPAAVYELMYGNEITVGKFRAALTEFARAIEAAHGITQKEPT
jgi:hypothetical protein